MVIALNGMYLTRRASGIANFIIDAVNELAKCNEIIVFANNDIEKNILSRLPEKNVKYVIKYRKYSTIWFFLDFSKLLKKEKFDILWNPAVWTPLGVSKRKKKLVTIHDFVSHEYKSTMRLVNRIVSTFIERRSIINADFLWCNSEYTKQKLQEYYPVRKCKEIFVGDAPSKFFRNLSILWEEKRLFLSSLKIEKPFFLFVGNLEPRKNLSFLLKVFEQFHQNHNVQLIVVGANEWGKSSLSEIVNEPSFPKDDVIFARYISNESLLMLYNLAECFISTSLNEGFGMPQAEAMKCGCPVIAAHNSAMIEVVADAGITVEGWNIEDWCSAIESVLNRREEIIEKQFERVQKYDWYKVISDLLQYLGEFCEHSR